MSLFQTLDIIARHAGLGRGVLALLPAFLATDLRRAAWFSRAKSGEALVDVSQLRPQMARAVDAMVSSVEGMGDYLEFGVFNGTSMMTMYDVLEEAGVGGRLIGFDSFEGLPPEAATPENKGWRPGCFACEMETTRARLTEAGIDEKRAILVRGWLKDTLTAETVDALTLRHASVIMIDVDIYTATAEALAFCAPLIGSEAIVIFDDWHYSNADEGEGQKKAFDQFLAAHPEFKAEPFGAYTDGEHPSAELFRVIRI
ncbi:MAG: TylF/MycF/NovP-related O-methyltransferase [Alphaproteobacteria bacterium]